MATNRELISTCRSELKLISGDNLLNDRSILSELRASANLLIKRELNLRKLTNTDSIFTTIPCMEMTQVPVSECCDYVDNKNISRTKEKIPMIGEGNYGYAIQGVYSINVLSGTGKKLKEITVNRYLNLLNLPVKTKEDYFFIQNGYLYVTNENVRAVRVVAYFTEDVPKSILYPKDCECTKLSEDPDPCKNPLDDQFKCPPYLHKQVLDLTVEKLLKTYYRVNDDKTSDNLDSQVSMK